MLDVQRQELVPSLLAALCSLSLSLADHSVSLAVCSRGATAACNEVVWAIEASVLVWEGSLPGRCKMSWHLLRWTLRPADLPSLISCATHEREQHLVCDVLAPLAKAFR